MIFCVTGVSYKTAPVEVREKLSFGDEELAKAFELLLLKGEVEECVILSTCNRVEIYAMLKSPVPDIIKNFIRDFHKFGSSLDEYVYCKVGPDALRHLCMVSAGLDSMVLGEPQIFGQVKDAYSRALENGAVHHAFEHLFSQVFSIVKRIRNKTRIGEKNVSVSYTAVKLAQSVFS